MNCHFCGQTYKITTNIPRFVNSRNLPKILQSSKSEYEKLHQKRWEKIPDGSYEILAAFAKGNKTVDIACGDGFVEMLAPETVGVEFSGNALKKAQKNGARYLVQATAEQLPFADDAFDIAMCAGSLEHFANPEKALSEMKRVSNIQILTVHRALPIPFAKLLFPFTKFVFGILHQPIEIPFTEAELLRLYEKTNLSIIFKGVWTLPINYGKAIPFLPVLQNIPSCFFVISIKKS